MKWFYILGSILVIAIASAAYLVFGDGGSGTTNQAAPITQQQPGSSPDDNLFKNLK